MTEISNEPGFDLVVLRSKAFAQAIIYLWASHHASTAPDSDSNFDELEEAIAHTIAEEVAAERKRCAAEARKRLTRKMPAGKSYKAGFDAGYELACKHVAEAIERGAK